MRLKFDLTEKGWHIRCRAGCRRDFVVTRRRMLLDYGTGSFAIHAAGLAFEDRRFAGVLEGTCGGIVELYSMLKSHNGLINPSSCKRA